MTPETDVCKQKPVIVYYDILQYGPDAKNLLYDNFEVISLADPAEDTQEALSCADVLLAPLGYFLGPEKIDLCPRLKVIGSNTTGHPHIEVDYAAQKGISVVTLKDHQDFLNTITPTAELTWGLVIALTRNIVPAFSSVLDGKWARWPFGGKSMLSRMSLGVAGLGRLGGKVASYGQCFGMIVRYFDPFVNEFDALSGVVRTQSLEELVGQSDVVTVHIPHEPETENLFSDSVFAVFKKGSYFINTSRGELVDEPALVSALENGRLAGAAVDVLDGEFVPGFENRVKEHPLVQYAARHSNLIITPHIGGSTHDAWSLTQKYTVEKIIEALAEGVWQQ
ncbi:MAG: hydroxyacid dehydrogenase [Desulfobulbaceae bacterium]|nr:hydroxyacid dehydrogenase [Desulfobulbaceae bacterium]